MIRNSVTLPGDHGRSARITNGDLLKQLLDLRGKTFPYTMKYTTTPFRTSLSDPLEFRLLPEKAEHRSSLLSGLTQRAKANRRERIRHLEEESSSSELRPPFSASCSRSRFRILQAILIGCISFSVSQVNALNIACPGDASVVEKQAAKEVRRYLFLRTGKAPELKAADNYASLPAGDVIVVAANSRPIITELKAEGNDTLPWI